MARTVIDKLSQSDYDPLIMLMIFKRPFSSET